MTDALPAPALHATPSSSRLASLDVFRGLTIATMILVNNGGDHSYAPLEHAEWHGWTPTDLVFPFFLFIVGVATPFSLAKRAANASRGELLAHIWARALSIFLLGSLLFASSLPWPNLDAPAGFTGTKVMRWIGFAGSYAAIFALLIPWRSRRLSNWLPILIAVLLVAYWITMHFVRIKAIANGWPEKTFGGGIFNPDQLRIPGVLQRIGICYGVGATIALFVGWRSVLASAILICAAYSVVMLTLKLDGHTTGSLSIDDNVARRIDVAVFITEHQNHAYRAYPDNEGILSTLPAIATVLLGVLAGTWLRSGRTAVERCAGLLAFAGPVILLGIVLDHALMPINKNLWTPSFTVFTAGMAMLVLGTIFYLCDVLNRRAWAWPLKVFGMNAIAAFVASSLVFRASKLFPIPDPRADHAGESVGVVSLGGQWIREQMTHASQHWAALASPQNLSLAYAIYIVLIIFVLMWLLYVCRIFVKV